MSGWLWPNGSTRKPTLTAPFGFGVDPVAGGTRFHTGDDFAGFTVNCAVGDGTVAFVGWESGNWGGGLQVWVDHGGGVQTRYKHHASTLVAVGDKVWAGHSLGIQGQTGYATGVHLHFEVRLNGVAVAPSAWLSPRVGGTTPAGDDTTPFTPNVQEDDMTKLIQFRLGDDDFFVTDTRLYHSPDAGQTAFTADAGNALVQKNYGPLNQTSADLLLRPLGFTFADAVALPRGASKPIGVDVRVDSTPVVTAVEAALSRLSGQGVDQATIDSIALAVREVLEPDVAAIMANIDDQPTEFVVTPKG
jgi:hypothetical protein